MELLKRYKNILLGLAILLAVAGGYWLWNNNAQNSGNADNSTLAVSSGFVPGISSEASFAGQQILSVLNELKQLNIDGLVFESAVFKSLVDHTIATTSEPLGRPDPFAPLPFEFVVEETKK
ncbi:MAG TPA: hypothetical protein VJH94_04915 [Candidatus Paceibacterota bacterium]